MLTEAERREARLLLEKLPTEDILALADTVSARMVTPDSRDDALEAILEYSESAKQLLRRKKVKREHIFMYLTEKKVLASSQADKPTLVRKVLKYWAEAGISPSARDHEQQRQAAEAMRASPSNEAFVSGMITLLPDGYGQSQCSPTSDAQTTMSYGLRGSMASLHDAFLPSASAEEGQSLAECFAPWFYKMLNSQNPAFAGLRSQQPWGPQHFWPDARLSIYVLPRGSQEDHRTALRVSDALAGLTRSGIFLNPNLQPSGVKGIKNVQGLVMVSVGGTFYHGPQCLGSFEQSFGLVRDTMIDNNWRVKHTSLKLLYGDTANSVLGEMAAAEADQPCIISTPL